MARQITIDRQRLSIVEGLKNRERGTVTDADSVVRQMRNERIKLINDRRMIEEATPSTTQAAEDLHKNRRNLTARIDELAKNLETAIATKRAAEENFQASVAVFENCAKFLGVKNVGQ